MTSFRALASATTGKVDAKDSLGGICNGRGIWWLKRRRKTVMRERREARVRGEWRVGGGGDIAKDVEWRSEKRDRERQTEAERQSEAELKRELKVKLAKDGSVQE